MSGETAIHKVKTWFVHWSPLILSFSMIGLGAIIFFAILFSTGIVKLERSSLPPIKTEAAAIGLTSQLDYTTFLPVITLKFSTWADCSQSTFGTMLLLDQPQDWITPASVLIYANDQLGITGLTGTGAPSDNVRDEYFGKLPGWTRAFLRGTYDELIPIQDAARIFGMQDMYECYGYGPESAHQAGEEALDPAYWVPKAEALAESAGKCLMYAPAVLDYEKLATPAGENEPDKSLLAGIISQIAPHVDIWMIQLAKYQLWADSGHDEGGNPYTMQDFANWVSQWVQWIRSTNPDIKIWSQLGIGKYDPIAGVCLEPQPAEYLLNYRETLAGAGIDGVWVMPSQPCQPCPASPQPGFPCSTDPQDNEYYRQSLANFQEAIEIACQR